MLSWPITANAVEFVSEDPLGALEATCRDLDTFRRLGVHSDLLITRMSMIRYVTDGYGKLIADMLGELSRETPLPDSCKRALAAPTADEASVCQAIRGEFALSMHIIDMTSDVQEPTIWTELFFDRDHYRALTAESLVRTCASSDQIVLDTLRLRLRQHRSGSVWNASQVRRAAYSPTSQVPFTKAMRIKVWTIASACSFSPRWVGCATSPTWARSPSVSRAVQTECEAPRATSSLALTDVRSRSRST